MHPQQTVQEPEYMSCGITVVELQTPGINSLENISGEINVNENGLERLT